jgi:hypothetical protein
MGNVQGSGSRPSPANVVPMPVGLTLSIAGAQGVTLLGKAGMSIIRSETVVPAACVSGRRCAGGYYYRRGVRVCRRWVACG